MIDLWFSPGTKVEMVNFLNIYNLKTMGKAVLFLKLEIKLR